MRLPKILKTATYIGIAVIIIGYAIFRSIPYYSGPDITVYEPQNGSTVASTTVEIIGRALRVNSLNLNGKPISFDESGNFRETLIIFRGINIITFEASDQFGRKEKSELSLLGSI